MYQAPARPSEDTEVSSIAVGSSKLTQPQEAVQEAISINGQGHIESPQQPLLRTGAPVGIHMFMKAADLSLVAAGYRL